jgi:immune inhibitor A
VKKKTPAILVGTAALALGAATLAPASAAPAPRDPASTPANHTANHAANQAAAHKPDNRPGPLTKRQNQLRAKALEMLDNGSARLRHRADGGATVALEQADAGTPGTGTETDYVEFPVNKTDAIFTVLSEFGGTGPLHNQIAEPDRTSDNSTYWVPDFDKAHYDEMFGGTGESFTDFYRQLSSGRYEPTVTTEDWVQVPGDAASYGGNRVEDDGGAWQFIADTGNAWYAAQKAAGKTDADVKSYLAQFDQWDRYDHDGDGDFNEPDGYIDHFQAIHAGEGEEAGGGAHGADAIWSHRWYVGTGYGTTGPAGNLLGGTQIGDTGIWIGDYTVEPENGGLGVFAHEFGHDLGLPDYYDTAGGENSTAFWTLMSSGSWLGHGDDAEAGGGEGIGTVPGLMGPEEKYELGWLDYSEVGAGQDATVNLGPAAHTYDGADQAVKVNLPDKTTSTPYVTPLEGDHAWWTGRGDDLSNTLTRSVPASSSVTVTASAWYSIEQDYDYLYGQYSVDGGATWTNVGKGLTGSSRDRWVGVRYSYRPGGQPSLFRWLYKTDGGVNEAGAFLDSVTVKSGAGTVTDGAEAGTGDWAADGWKVSTGTETKTTAQYYLMENRQYVGYDDTLRTGPYQFSFAYTAPNKVEFFGFQEGMLVWYVDLAYADNNTSADPGHGAVLPVDARPAPFTYGDGTMPSNRRQPFDATFGLQAVPQTCLHKEVLVGKGKRQSVETDAACTSSPALAQFADTGENAYWSADNPMGSTKLPGSGVTATVTGQDGDVLTVAVHNP